MLSGGGNGLKLSHNNAFTLAEVLITLGVIGIIAALTLPTVINKYKVKVLKAQFEVADNIVQQAVKKTCLELGCDSLNEYYDGVSTDANVMRNQAKFVSETWLKQFPNANQISRMVYYGKGYNLFGEKLNDMAIPYNSNDYFYILPNGVLIGPFMSWGRESMGMMFDTNGPHKGPNRIGYDIFVYSSYTSKGGSYTTLCDPRVVHSQSLSGCWAWAHNNINPKTGQSNYWDILYKPRSWWNE